MELFDRCEFEESNARTIAAGGEPATAQTVLLGVTKASLSTSSFLAAMFGSDDEELPTFPPEDEVISFDASSLSKPFQRPPRAECR